jgi:DMSO reductase anchor subunit
MKWITIIAFILIIGSLGSALFYMIRDRGQTEQTFRFLALRVGFSVTLFLGAMLAWKFGWIQTTGIPVR